MGCKSCGGSSTGSKSPKKSKVAKSKVVNTTTEVVDETCFKLYPRLSEIDKKATKVYTNIKKVDKEQAIELMSINEFLRGLIIKLKKECPTEDDMLKVDIYEEYVNAKYSKFFE